MYAIRSYYASPRIDTPPTESPADGIDLAVASAVPVSPDTEAFGEPPSAGPAASSSANETTAPDSEGADDALGRTVWKTAGNRLYGSGFLIRGEA